MNEQNKIAYIMAEYQPKRNYVVEDIRTLVESNTWPALVN